MPSGVEKKKWVNFLLILSSETNNNINLGEIKSKRRKATSIINACCSIFRPKCKKIKEMC